MSAIVWDAIGQHYYENGVDHGVLYPPSDTPNAYGKGVAWNGLTTITHSPDGAEPNAVYADNIKYLDIMSVEEFKATIEALSYPEEFNACDGKKVISGVYFGQQPRKLFCLSYRTRIGNDLSFNSGYKLHIVYNAMVAPAEESYETRNDSPEPMTRSWEMTTTPEGAPNGLEPTSHLILDSRLINSEIMKAIEDALYGTENSDPHVLTPKEIYEILGGYTVIGIDHSADTFSVYCDVSDDSVNPKIEWGDGEITLLTGSGMYSHSYSQHDNDLEVKISDVTNVSMYNSTVAHRDYIKYVIIKTTGDISNNAFSGCSNLNSVTIGDGVTGIGAHAFYSCSHLNSVTIGDGVTSIGTSAFYSCAALTSVTIGKGVTSIGDSAFSRCGSLPSINIPDNVTSISNSAFSSCAALTSVTIGKGVTSTGGSAFASCSSLVSIIIPDNVVKISDSTFYNCTHLASVTIGKGVTSIGESAFYGCSELVSFNIPDNVVKINSSAFYNCTHLASVTIGKGVTYIYSSAFYGCSALASVTFTSGRSSVPTLGSSNAFSGNASGRKFYVQADLVDAWKTASNWYVFASYIEALPNS